jgi:ABC-type antimicrobial peptide transport system permease subunit
MKKATPSPPQSFLRFFRWFCHPELKKYIEGDLMELYDENVNTSGKKKADIKFVINVLLLLRPGIIRPSKGYHPVNNYAMFKSYFKIGWRNLTRNKGYSFINVGGLAAGMTVAILIGLWLYDELSFNMNFTNYDRIAQVMQNQTFNGQVETWGNQARQMAPELRNTFGSDFKYAIMSSGTGGHKLTYENQSVTKTGDYTEPEIAEMLTLHMTRGSRQGLKDPHSILLSESTARSIFGNADPMNKLIRIDDELDVKVTGVYSDLPHSSSYANLTFIAPWDLFIQSYGLEARTGWGNSWFQCIVQIADNANMKEVSAKIKDAKLNAIRRDKSDDDDRFKPEIFLHPMSRWHLYSDFSNGVSAGGRIQYVWLFGISGAFVLMLACINFMNLSTARSEKRAKEVGIRKSIGSVRTQLISQFFSESLLVTAFAFVLSLILVQLALPWFNEISGKHIRFLWANPFFWLAGFGFTFATGLIAGSYPALFLSSFQPVKALKGAFRLGRSAAIPRRVLVVLQFTVSITLIVGTIVVFRQIQFAQDRPVGYDYNGLISTPIKTDEIRNHYDAFRNELLATGAVKEVAASENAVTQTYTTNSGFDWSGKDPDVSEEFVTVCVTPEFGKTIGWQIRDGRDFSAEMASDTAGFVINEAAARYMGLEDPVGEIVKWNGNGEWKILGVTEDLVTQSPYSPVKQMIFFLHSDRVSFTNYNVINIRIDPSSTTGEALTEIESVYKKYDPANAFQYAFTDVEYGKKFDNERRVAQLASVFAGIAIFISCLGLFGLAAYVAEQRTKEIGIRKVLGASVANLWRMLSKDFVVLVIISCVIAIPVSYYFMNDWLMQYEYRTTISWHVFGAACAGALIITLLTVSYQAITAAVANPVKSLRSE